MPGVTSNSSRIAHLTPWQGPCDSLEHQSAIASAALGIAQGRRASVIGHRRTKLLGPARDQGFSCVSENLFWAPRRHGKFAAHRQRAGARLERPDRAAAVSVLSHEWKNALPCSLAPKDPPATTTFQKICARSCIEAFAEICRVRARPVGKAGRQFNAANVGG